MGTEGFSTYDTDWSRGVETYADMAWAMTILHEFHSALEM